MTSTLLLDAETMFDTLMSAAAPSGVTTVQDLQPDSGGEIPLVMWRISNNGQYDHALWSVTLIINVIAEPTSMYSICSSLYAAIAGWNAPDQGAVNGIGYIVEANDGAAFDKVGETFTHGKHLAQFSGTFNISIRQM